MRKLTLFSLILAMVCGFCALGVSQVQAQGPHPPHYQPAPVYRRHAPPPPRRHAPPPPVRYVPVPPPPVHYAPAPPPPPHYAPAPPPPTWGGVIGGLIDVAIIESRRP